MVAPGYRVTLERMRMPHFSFIERAWSALRTFGPHLGMVLLPGGLLILCVLLVVERRNAIAFLGRRRGATHPLAPRTRDLSEPRGALHALMHIHPRSTRFWLPGGRFH